MSVPDVELFYTDDGAGVRIILLVHGLSCDSDDWVWQIGALTKNYRVVAVDLRGHGRSSAPESGYTPEILADDLARFLGQLGVAGVVAVGHSLGGAVASALAVRHPRLVDGLVTIEPAYGVSAEDAIALDTISNGLQGAPGRDALLALIAGVEGDGTPGFLREMHRRKVLRTSLPVLQQAFSGLWEAPRRFGLADQAGRFLRLRQCPVLAVYASPARAGWDAATFHHEYSRALAWEGAGHWLHQERPDDFNSLLVEWIDELPSA
jgi:pimeloyl-ACP methyl ester carboxylesterase